MKAAMWVKTVSETTVDARLIVQFERTSLRSVLMHFSSDARRITTDCIKSLLLQYSGQTYNSAAAEEKSN